MGAPQKKVEGALFLFERRPQPMAPLQSLKRQMERRNKKIPLFLLDAKFLFFIFCLFFFLVDFKGRSFGCLGVSVG